MSHYASPMQFIKIFCWSLVMQGLGAPYWNLVLYMAGAPILAALRLFYFGTYLPHLPPKRADGEGRDGAVVMHWTKSHCSSVPRWLSFLKVGSQVCWGVMVGSGGPFVAGIVLRTRAAFALILPGPSLAVG